MLFRSCREWEEAASTVEESGVRTVFLRTGIVLTATAGALGKMLLPFKMGAGGPIGNGKQWMSWISLDDEIYAINHLMMNSDSKGVYNLTAPNPIEQKSFPKFQKKPSRYLGGELKEFQDNPNLLQNCSIPRKCS